MEKSEFMKLAADEGMSNVKTLEGGPFGAVIVKDGQVIAACHNQVLLNHDPTAHAEVQTIRAACQKLGTHDLSGCELYTNCYPCPMCLGAIIWANIKKVYYGNTAKDADAIGFRDEFIYKFIENKCKDFSVLDMEQLDRDETIKSFNEFSKSQTKKIY